MKKDIKNTGGGPPITSLGNSTFNLAMGILIEKTVWFIPNPYDGDQENSSPSYIDVSIL